MYPPAPYAPYLFRCWRCSRLIGDVAKGSLHMHGIGLVHKDIKPENVLIFDDETLGAHAKLVDFGFTRGEPLTIRRDTCTSPLSVRSATSCLSVPHQRQWSCIDRGGHRRRGGGILAFFFYSYRPTYRCDVVFSAVDMMALFSLPTEAGATCPGAMGTPGYLPLECLVSQNVTCHASQDVFAVAVMLLLVCVKFPMMRSNMFCHEVSVWYSQTCSALLYVFAVGNGF